MDNENHKNTWNNFTKFVLWGTVAVILVPNFNGNIFIIIKKFFNEFSVNFRK
jgi:hypothetical protein